ncbi:MAG: DUF4167 domain-containing protein [Paracoccus sp. (in: a-proteobacteria)]
MRSSKSRSRSKSNRQRSLGNIVNRVFDSSGPEGKVRGTPQQIIDKYLTLARDAQLSNDRVAEQAFLQHAEHYTRMLGEAQREMAERQQQNQQHQQNHGQNQSRGGDEDRENGGAPREDEGTPQPRAEGGHDRRAQPAAQPAPASEPEAMSLPDVVVTDSSDQEGGPVETPEGKGSTRRPRAPRNSAPRLRRKPVASDQPASEAPAAPATESE